MFVKYEGVGVGTFSTQIILSHHSYSHRKTLCLYHWFYFLNTFKLMGNTIWVTLTRKFISCNPNFVVGGGRVKLYNTRIQKITLTYTRTICQRLFQYFQKYLS